MRILVCPQEFKGSLTAGEAARAIADGLIDALPGADLALFPLADGGPGTVEIVCAAAGGTLMPGQVRGPLGDPVVVRFGMLPDDAGSQRAVIEAAAAAGLVLVPAERRDPTRASTFGVGEQIAAAIDAGADEVIIGVGGTGTNDGGAGALQALGVRLLDGDGLEVDPGPLELARVQRIDASAARRRLEGVRLRLAVDVRNPLLGERGATAVYGPQKGVTGDLAPRIEAALAHWAMLLARDLGVDVTGMQGAGAGGGMTAGLAALGASIESGAALVGEAVGLDEAIRGADVVVTGEGSLDAQTGYGKTVAYVAERAMSLGRPCLAVAGVVASVPPEVTDTEASRRDGMTSEEAMRRAAELVRAAAERLGRRLSPSPGS